MSIKEQTVNNYYRGYSLFSDIECNNLRRSNTAVVLANIFEDKLNAKGKIGIEGMAMLLAYFNRVKEEDKMPVKARYQEIMLERGYIGE